MGKWQIVSRYATAKGRLLFSTSHSSSRQLYLPICQRNCIPMVQRSTKNAVYLPAERIQQSNLVIPCMVAQVLIVLLLQSAVHVSNHNMKEHAWHPMNILVLIISGHISRFIVNTDYNNYTCTLAGYFLYEYYCVKGGSYSVFTAVQQMLDQCAKYCMVSYYAMLCMSV